MQVYDAFPVTRTRPPTADFLHAYRTDITLIRDCVTDTEVAPHTSPFSLKVVRSGVETYTVSGRQSRVTPGACLLVPADVDYGSWVGRTPTDSLSIHFPEAFLAQAMARRTWGWDGVLGREPGDVTVFSSIPAWLRRMPDDWSRLIERLAVIQSPYEADMTAWTLLQKMVDDLLDSLGAVDRIPAARPAVRRELFRRVAAAKLALETDPAEAWTLARLAQVACLSPFHFHRVYQAAFGLSPMADLRAHRLERARTLLRTTRLSIADIASRVRFEDQGAFARRFRQVHHMTPTAWRNAA